MLEDFDDPMQNKTNKYVKMCVFLLYSLSSDSTSFLVRNLREKNFTILSSFVIIENETLHYCETLLYIQC